MADRDDIPDDDGEVFDVDSVGENKKPEKEPEPLYRIFSGSRIPVSKHLGPRFKTMRDLAIRANDLVNKSWNECVRYYNGHQEKAEQTNRGTFRRGDSTENVVYSNINVMLPAIYSKDPDFVVNTTDGEDQDFATSAKTLLNALFKAKKWLNSKHKIRRAVGFSLLTNCGVMKLDYVQKEDSREHVVEEMEKLGREALKSKNQQELADVYGRMAALETSMEVFQPSGPNMSTVLPWNWVIDPNAENPDGLDANWQMERVWFATEFIKAKYMRPCPNEEDSDRYVYLYKPTHKAVLDEGGDGEKNDALGLVLNELSGEQVVDNEEQERAGYRNQYYTECWMVWDKTTRRVYLFARDDWTWPLWVWDDPFKLTQFFPYFLISFGMSTGGTVTVGETSYYLDQQDEINEINRQVARIRRSIFNHWFYNSEAINRDEVEKLTKAIKGAADGTREVSVTGIKLGDGGDLKKVFTSIDPPSIEFEAFFNKEPILNAINRISNTSDAVRGVQFKANTTEDAVQSYQDAARMSIGAKVEIVEDRLGEMGYSLLEMCVQFMDKQTVEGIIGKKAAEGYDQMPIEQFQSMITAEVVAGTTEKPNSTFKKREAIQVAQAVGQFADAAPGTAMMIILRMMENAFSEVNIRKEDWEMMFEEIKARTQRGDSTGQGGQPPAEGGQPPQGGQPQGDGLPPELANLPPEVKQKVEEMKASGAGDQEIIAFLKNAVAGSQGAQPPQQGQPPAGAPIQ